jgi:hypothetical protein
MSHNVAMRASTMMFRRTVILACLLLSVTASLAIAAPQGNEPTYKVDSETTVSGTVTKVFARNGRRGTPRTRATIRQANGSTIDIHLGPSTYAVDKGMTLKAGDVITALGSRIVEDGSPLVVVRRITRGKQTLDMRRADGRRLWPDRYR